MLFFLESCSFLSTKPPLLKPLENYEELSSKDYLDHLSSLGSQYIRSPRVELLYLSKSSEKYLKEKYWKIVGRNESLFSDPPKPKFYMIKDRTPFYFSLPSGQFYF